MTKLPKPIVLTITHVENAISHQLRAHHETDSEQFRRIAPIVNPFEMTDQIDAALKSQGIDWRTWEPPQPITIAGHEVEALNNGSIKIGLTVVDRSTLDQIVKLSDEAMGKEWPKYYRGSGNCLYRFDHEITAGYCETCRGLLTFSHKDRATDRNLIPLTPTQAAEILKGRV